jgi:nucleoside-diphosphate-sugar epimerase
MASFSHPTLLMVGAGFLGQEICRRARNGGWELIPVVRSPASAEKLRQEFPPTMAADATARGFWESFSSPVAGLVWAVAPSRLRPSDNFEAMQQGAEVAAGWAGSRGIPMVYISSTSVYAEDGGAWVDETSPVTIEDSRSRAMVAAEQACLRSGGTVLRCAGLYGGERVLKTDGEGPERWLNLIHVEDAARAAATALRDPGQIFNVCEDEPRRRGKEGGFWPEGMRRVRRNKRVSNARLRATGWRPMAAIPDESLAVA